MECGAERHVSRSITKSVHREGLHIQSVHARWEGWGETTQRFAEGRKQFRVGRRARKYLRCRAGVWGWVRGEDNGPLPTHKKLVQRVRCYKCAEHIYNVEVRGYNVTETATSTHLRRWGVGVGSDRPYLTR